MSLDGLPVNAGSTPEAGAPAAPDPLAQLPEDALILISTRNLVLFPGTVLPVTLGRQRSVFAAQAAIRTNRPVGLVLQRDPAADDPMPAELHRVGTEANLLRYVTSPDGTHHVIAQGEKRFRIAEFLEGFPFFVARVEWLPESRGDRPGDRCAAAEPAQPGARSPAIIAADPGRAGQRGAGRHLGTATRRFDRQFHGHHPAGKAGSPRNDRRSTSGSNASRELLSYRLEVLRLSRKISDQTKETLDDRQREFLLREQLKTIQKELGEGDDAKSQEITELSDKIAKAKMPEEVETHAKKEVARLERMPEASGEYSMARTYIEWLAELPWSAESETPIDIAEARATLDADHYGLKKIKRRILEFLAMHKLNPHGRSPILCFVGPPGVGKTSLGQSIARATGRKFVRVSLGGVHDEAEIRGHRRTYIGALPGNICRPSAAPAARDCVMMLDEIDKLGRGIHGDPSSALLEVLDPEQNSTFRDNYLGVPFDLSKVMFITTANVLDTSRARCATAWRSSTCPATPRTKNSRSPAAISSPGK